MANAVTDDGVEGVWWYTKGVDAVAGVVAVGRTGLGWLRLALATVCEGVGFLFCFIFRVLTTVLAKCWMAQGQESGW